MTDEYTSQGDRGRPNRKRRPLPRPLIYRESQVYALTSLSRTARENSMAAGTFPKPIPLSIRARGWLVSEIEQWLTERIAARDATQKTSSSSC